MRSSAAGAAEAGKSLASTVLEVSHLSVAFDAEPVVHDLSFSVEAGCAFAIIGPNGGGKTVLFRALIGALPFGGTIRWEPGAIIGYAPQKLDIGRELPITGVDFLRAKADVTHAASDSVARALDMVNLRAQLARQPVGTLSGGQFQRLLLAFALIGRPSVLLLDEPTAGVDESGQRRIHSLLRRLQKEEGLTVLFISHELGLVYEHADRVMCLSRGYAHVGSPLDVLTQARLGDVYSAPRRSAHHDHS